MPRRRNRMANENQETAAAFEKVTVQIEKVSAKITPEAKADFEELKKLVAKLKEVALKPKAEPYT
jgi:hypothetical protein